MRRCVAFGVLALLGACGTSVLPEGTDGSTYTPGESDSSMPSDANPPIDSQALPQDAKPPIDGQPPQDAKPPIDGQPPQDAKPPIDSQPPPQDALPPKDALPPPNDALPPLDAPGPMDAAAGDSSDATLVDAGSDSGDAAPDVLATLVTDTSYAMDGVARPAYSMHEWQDITNIQTPVRVLRIVFWSDVTLTEPLCTVARQTKKAGSRELYVEIHRKLGVDAAGSIPLGTYTRGSNGPDSNTMIVKLSYNQYGSPACLPALEKGDAIQPNMGAGTVTITSVSTTQLTASFSMTLDTAQPALRSFSGSVTSTPPCANPANVSSCTL